MKKTLLLSEKDKNKYEKEISNLVDDIIPIMTDFYNKFDITLIGVTYNSTLEYEQTSKISFEVISNNFYPSLDISLSRVGSAFRTPSQRILLATFIITGVSDDLVNTMYIDYGISQILIVKSTANGNIKDRVNEIISQTAEKIDEWYGFATAADIFIF